MEDRWSARIIMVSLLILVAVAASAGPAQAQFAGRFAGRLQGGYGFGDGYGGMVGGSVGIEFPLLFGQPAYVGPWAMYNGGGTFLRDGDILDQKSTFLGIEGGGAFLDKPFMIRGAGNIAAAFITTRIPGQEKISETALDLSGGVAFGYQLGHWYVAAEPYTFLIVGSDNMGASFNLFLTVGFRPEVKNKEE
jgi:hypothetical protein